MSATGAIITIRNNNNMRNRRIHFSKDNLYHITKQEKPKYNTISESDLKKLRKRLQAEQLRLKQQKAIAIAIISVITIVTFSLFLFSV